MSFVCLFISFFPSCCIEGKKVPLGTINKKYLKAKKGYKDKMYLR